MIPKRLVLVTRPEPGLSESMCELERRGWHGLACPALEIIPADAFPPLECRAILLTSGQALPALSRQDRDKLICAVGKKTAERARQIGFRNVQAAGGNAESLKRFCLERNLTGADVILACGQGWQGQDYGRDLKEQLSVKSLCAYRVERKKTLPQEVIEVLKAESVDSVLFYSSETMAAFVSLCSEAESVPCLTKVTALCYSEAIAKRAETSALWSSVIIGPYPPACI